MTYLVVSLVSVSEKYKQKVFSFIDIPFECLLSALSLASISVMTNEGCFKWQFLKVSLLKTKAMYSMSFLNYKCNRCIFGFQLT